MCNQGVINIIAKINKVGTTTHDEWYGNLRNNTLILNKWYDHVVVDKSSDDKTEQGVMDGTIPSAVVDSGTTSNVGRYGDGLELTGRPSTKIFKVATGHETKAPETETMDHEL